MKKYYLHDGVNQMGPFNIDDLKNKDITIETPIWYEGLQDWITAGKVKELNDYFRLSTPPPLGTKPLSPSPVYTSLPQQGHFPDKPNRTGSIGKKLLILTGIIVLILIGVYIYNQVEYQQYENARRSMANAEEDAKATIRNNITSYVTAERSEYQYRPIGGIFNLSISVNNKTNYIIDNVKVRVIYIKTDGNVWDSRIIDFNLLNPQTKGTIKVSDTNRGTSVKYEIVSIKSSALGLY